MNIYYYALSDVPESWPSLEALAAYSLDEQMLPLTPAKLQTNTLAVVAMHGVTVAGYMAQTAYYEHAKTAEVGSLIVNPDYRGKGIGTELIRRVTSRVLLSGAMGDQDIETILAFCNPLSAPLFQKRGYQHVSLTSIPRESLFACQDCPKHCVVPVDECCDRAYIYADSYQVK